MHTYEDDLTLTYLFSQFWGSPVGTANRREAIHWSHLCLWWTHGVGHATMSLPTPASCPIVLRELMTS